MCNESGSSCKSNRHCPVGYLTKYRTSLFKCSRCNSVGCDMPVAICETANCIVGLSDDKYSAVPAICLNHFASLSFSKWSTRFFHSSQSFLLTLPLHGQDLQSWTESLLRTFPSSIHQDGPVITMTCNHDVPFWVIVKAWNGR